jgi:hypothetical protein
MAANLLDVREGLAPVSSQRLITALVVGNVVALLLGALAPQPPSALNASVSALLLIILIGGAFVAGQRHTSHWLRDAIRDVVTGQALGWAVGLAVVGLWRGGLSSPRWLAAFAPIFLTGCAVVTALCAPVGHRFARRQLTREMDESL